MSRKPISRKLPTLDSLFPRFRGVGKGDHGVEKATAQMQRAARLLRRNMNQSFYSMREAAGFCAVTVSTMGLVYQRLEDEGLVQRIRGSRTVLLGKAARSRYRTRRIVSVPLQLSSLVSSHFTRRFCERINEELCKHHCVANLVLNQQVTESPDVFARRLLRQSDIVIWVMADRRVRETMLLLRDHGVENVIMLPVEDPFLPATYIMDWNFAYRQAIADWKASGIRDVVVARPVLPAAQRTVDNFLRLLRDDGCSHVLAEATAADLRDKTEALTKKHRPAACAILEHETSHRLCTREPSTMARLASCCRLFFGRGSVYAPYFLTCDHRADVAGFVGDEVAVRVAQDFGHRPGKQEAVQLQPRWMPRVELSNIFA